MPCINNSSNTGGWWSITCTLLIISSLYSHIIGVSGQSEFRDSPHNATGLLTHSVTLTCSVPDNPPANIRWTVNNSINITASDRLNVSYNSATGESRLVINNLQYTDNGAYQCEALNSDGSESIASGIGYVTAVGLPVFRTPLEPIAVPIRGVATFYCDVYSNPVLQSVHWIFNGIRIVPDGLHIVAIATQLTINNVQSDDEGSYGCVVTNTYGTRQSSSVLTIEDLPDLVVFIRPSTSVDAVEGNTVTITCTVEGGVPSTLGWYRRGMELIENASVGLSHTSTNNVVLTLRNVTQSNDGTHTCIAVTAAGDIVRKSVAVNVLTLPRFVSKPGNITVDVGAPVQVAVSCEATGSPRPVISWLGPNNILLNVTGSNLTLDGTSFSTSFAGKYICVATNSVGQSTTEFYVFVQGPPMITPLAPLIDVGVGSDVSIVCTAQGYPAPTVQWSRPSGASLPLNSYVFNYILTITDIGFTNGGMYQCTASNNCPEDRCAVVANTTIMVHAPPVVTDAPLNIYVMTQDMVTLRCGFDSTLPVNVTWTKEEFPSQQIVAIVMDERITISNDNNIGELIIPDATSIDSGLYVCAGVTIAGTAIATANVVVGTSPDFTSYPQDTDLNIGDSIVLSCSASGDPPPQIAWERTDQRTGVRTVLSGSDIAALSNGGLPLVNVRQDDSGLYHCIADNQVDEIEATAIIRVQGPPLVQSITPTIIVADNNAVLTCNLIFDYPSSSIQWSRSDGLSTVAGRMNIIQNRSLIIVPANVSDAVTYTCVAANQFGSSSYSAAVTVHFRPTISLEILNYTHFIDDTTTLPCPVSSNPSSTIEWRMGVNMTELQGSRYQVDSSGTLTITQLKLPDSDTYHCIATNYLSSDVATTTIVVEGPPPENITVNTSASTSLLVGWNESSVTTTDLSSYQVIFREEFGNETDAIVLDQTNLRNRSVTLNGLIPFTEYRIVIRGLYVVITRSGDVTLISGLNATTTAITAEDFPTGSPQNITTDSDIEHVDIIFEAVPEENRNGIIIGYNIYYRPSVPEEFINVTGGVYDDNGTNITIANFTLSVFRPTNTSANLYQYTLDGLNDDGSYDFFMEAFNSVGTGPSTDIFTVQTEKPFPTTLVVVITSTVGGLIIITAMVVMVICCCYYYRRQKKSHEAEADRRTARNVKKLIISGPATHVPPDTTSSAKFSVKNTEGDVIPLNPKVIKSEDRAPSPEPGETALQVKQVTFEDDQQPDRPVSEIYSEPADCLSIYNEEVNAAKSTEEEIKVMDDIAKSTEEEIKVVDDAFKDITDKEPLYAMVPESHKRVKKEKRKSKAVERRKKRQEARRTTITEETTLEDIDTTTAEGQEMHRMLDAASAGMF